MTSQKEKDLRASMGFVKDYYNDNPMQDPGFSQNPSHQVMDDWLDIYKKDAIISSAVDTVGEEAVRNRGYFVGSKSAIKQATDLWKKLDFYRIAEIHVKTQHVYGDSFIEIAPDEETGAAVGELHNLETTEMFIGYDKHGKVIYYEQTPFEVTAGKIQLFDEYTKRWVGDETDNVIFMPLKELGSKVRSYFPLEPIIRSLTAREYGHYFLQTTFKNFKPQTIYSAPNDMSPKQVESLVTSIQAADKDPSKKILSIGELKVNNTGMYDFKKDIVDILNYLRQEILTVTRVPGVYVGITSDSNRGIGEFQANAFQGHLLRLQRDIEKIASIILKKAGINAEFKMKPPSVKAQGDIIDHAKKLRDMGYGDDVITPYLYENGISVPQTAKFEKEDKMSMDDYESRQGSDKGVTEGKVKLNSEGRSEAGKEKQTNNDKSMRASIANKAKGFFYKLNI